tara:strand:+ start:446 stop:721 length:276 start_codon:yes stop_codon:yes gene_type:complete
MEEKIIISPCISVCKTDPISGFCYGCGRTNDDKKNWKDANTSDKWKRDNIEKIKKRLSSWQLEAFEKSYKYKTEFGISLIKKKLLEQKNNN